MATTKRTAPAPAQPYKPEQVWDDGLQRMVDPRPLAHMVMRIVTTQTVPLFPNPDGGTYGQAVDTIIAHALDNEEEIQSFEIEFEPDAWSELRVKHDKNKR